MGRRKKRRRYVLTFICPADNQVTICLKDENTRKRSGRMYKQHVLTFNNNTTTAAQPFSPFRTAVKAVQISICMEGIEDSIVTPFPGLENMKQLLLQAAPLS